MSRRFSFLFWFTIIIGSFFFPFQTDAARLFAETRQTTMAPGQRFEVTVRVNSEGETVNAFEGTIKFPPVIRVSSLRDGNSLVSLWAERPHLDGNDIVFSGIVPGGWHGSNGLLFSFVAEAATAGSGSIDFFDSAVLLNDGKGTPAPVSSGELALNVDLNTPLTEFKEEVSDYEPPEPFTIEVAKNPALFDGDAFAVFIAQDKGSGIDHYEILETKTKLSDETAGEWERTESPYCLHDQSLYSYIYVRAVDVQGNVRVSVRVPEKQGAIPPSKAPALLVTAVLVIAFVSVLIIFWLLRKRKG
ncbi:MAG: cohesin domain-containing protein [Patescibacteria group bacterium]|nr:cohesin domain-containing protein [Patescibacteria group bacterium]MDD5294934.1 cohesin domain-containing protein [Patescibacteria group bacterium]MDD5554460.1 cohesin domain-containing protein [Patescibacteria group bacterium]